MRGVTLAALLLAATLPGLAQSEDMAWAILEEAIERSRAQGPATDLRFTGTRQTVQNGETVDDTVYRFDPLAPAGERFILVSEDGASPDPERVADYAADRANDEASPLEFALSVNSSDSEEGQDPTDSLRFSGWEGDTARFLSDRPLTGKASGIGDVSEILDKVEVAWLVSRADDGKGILRSVRFRLTEPVKPNLASKIKKMDVQMDFALDPATGRLLPVRKQVDTVAKALFQTFKLSQTETFGDFRQVDQAQGVQAQPASAEHRPTGG
ncbi:MAG: hypothetical protein ACFB22_14140 [Rhodothalassiaceae bacterium]